MANIAPNETVKLYSGIRLDPEYRNTLRFATLAAQTTFFHTTLLPVVTLSNLSYQRVTKGVIRVQYAVGSLNSVNYMAFKNTDLNNKWFYAFVRKVEYVNNITSDIYYDLDYAQSYMFDVAFTYSYVEREHAAVDTVGSNTTPEPISSNEAWPVSIQEINVGSNGYAVVCAKVDMEDDDDFAGSAITGNLVSTVKYYIFNAGRSDKTIGNVTYRGLTNLTGKLMDPDWANAASEIVSFFEFPFLLIAEPYQSTSNCESRYVQQRDYTITNPTTLHGYTPRNKKLFTFPFSYITVDNGETVNQYRQEWFKTATIAFRLTGALCCNPEVYLMPLGYANSSGNDSPCWSQKCVISDFPQVPFAIDSYKAWLAQTQSTRKAKIITGVASGAGTGVAAGAKLGAAAGGIGAAAGGAIGGILGAITGGIGAAGMNEISAAEARDMANKYSGASTGSTELAVNQQRFRVNQMCVTANQAAIIDDFFDMFGYAVNRVKVPNVFSRSQWNYIKTNGCNFTGSAPAEAVDVLKRIHDKGITYWANHDNIGNYSLTNSIV